MNPPIATGHVTPERIRREVQARFNPIANLTPEMLARQLAAARTGYQRDLQITWEAMEERDGHLKTVAAKRKRAAARLPWEILTVDQSAEAKAQAEILRTFYNNLRATSVMEQDQVGGVSLLLRQMMDAVGRRYAVHEIVWKPSLADGLTAEFRYVPQWFFENKQGKLRFLQAEYATDGVDLAADGWLVTTGDGLMEACSVLYMFKHLPFKDWLSYSEKFGMPGVLGKTDATPNSEEWKAMEEAVAAFGQDWAAVCNRSGDIELVEASGGGTNLPFPPLVEYCDRAMASLWRGADLSTMSQGNDGVGASLQGDESDLLLEDDAQLLSETLNQRVDRPVIRHARGVERPLAYIKVLAPKRRNVETDIRTDEFLTARGVRLSVRDALERYGRAEANADEAILLPSAAPAVAQPGMFANERSLVSAALPQFAGAVAADLRPLVGRLERILAIEDESIRTQRLAAFRAELPDRMRDIIADPESASVLANAMAASLVNGLTGDTKE